MGKNNSQNDLLTCKLAGKGDIWFHTQKIHGSHVILWTEGADPDLQSLNEAAVLAAWFSQARDSSVVFSVEEEQSTSGGSKVQVTTSTYHYKIFVAEPQSLWIIPFYYQKGPRTYELGTPVSLTRELIQDVSLSGQKDRKLEVTFRLKPAVGLDQVVMVLEPFQFQKNRHYPFDFFQEEACTQAYATAQRLALLACGKDNLDLEESRLKNACDNHAVSAFMCGFFGMAAAISGGLLPALVLFGAAAVLLVLILVKGQIPKLSLVLVILEALGAYFFSR